MASLREKWNRSAARYASFMSYSHAADGRLAPSLQRGIQRLGKPWYRPPIIRLFRDETSLAANPGLWSSIQAGLEQSEYFLLMCSPKAAASPWVEKEVTWWLAHRPVQRLLLVVTEGQIAWDSTSGDFAWSLTDCLPRVLEQQFREEPYYIDLRWARNRADLSLRNPRFRTAVLTIAASLHGKPMEELDSEDLRQQKRLQAVSVATVALVLLLLLFAYASVHNFRAASRDAASAHRIADSRRIAAKASAVMAEHGDLHQAIVLGVLAWRLSPTQEAGDVLRQLATNSADVARIIGRHAAEGLQLKGFTVAKDGSPLLVTLDSSGSLMFWHIPGGNPAGPAISLGPNNTPDLFFSHDGSIMLTAGSDVRHAGDVVVTNLFTRTSTPFPVQQLSASFRTGDLPTGRASLSPGGRFVAILSQYFNQVAVWDTAGGTVTTASLPRSSDVFAIAFLDEERLQWLAGKPEGAGALSHLVTGVWNRATHEVRTGTPAMQADEANANLDVRFSADGARVVLYGTLPPLLSFKRDAAFHLQEAELPGYASMAPAETFYASMSDTGQRLAASWNQKTVVWDLQRSTVLKTLDNSLYGTLSRDGRWLATLSSTLGGNVSILDLETDQGRAEALGARCSFSEDGGQQCIQQLCEKAGPSLQQDEDLRRVLGDMETDRLKRIALSRPCLLQEPT